MVFSIVVPGGVVTCVNMMPWSSSGRNALGRRMKRNAMTPTMAR